MISKVLIRKYAGGSSLLLAACSLAIFAFAWIRVWVVSLLDMSQFKTILDQFREYEKFAPIEFDALTTYTGRVGMTYDEPVVIFCIVVWCISRGSDVVAGELNRGTLEMILAQPIKRMTLLLSHAVVTLAGLALLCLLVWAGIFIGVQVTSVEETEAAPASITIPIINITVPMAGDANKEEPKTTIVPLAQRVDTRLFGPATFNLFSFGFFVTGLATLFSAMDRYRWRAIGAVITVYVLQLVMFGLGKSAQSLDWLLSLTFFSCYKAQKMTAISRREGIDAGWSVAGSLGDGLLPPMVYPLILLGFGLLFYVVAARIFVRRDLPAPL